MLRTRVPLTLSAIVLAAGLGAGGCYERVVSAHGFGADTVTVERANSPDPVKTTKLRQSTTHKEIPAGRMRVQER